MSILGGGFSISTASAPIADDLFDAASAVSECGLHSLEREHHVLLMLSDGLAGDQQQVVRGAYATLGVTVPLVGGCAGDDLAMEQTKQFFDGQVLENGIVAASIASDAPSGLAFATAGEALVNQWWLLTPREQPWLNWMEYRRCRPTEPALVSVKTCSETLLRSPTLP